MHAARRFNLKPCRVPDWGQARRHEDCELLNLGLEVRDLGLCGLVILSVTDVVQGRRAAVEEGCGGEEAAEKEEAER